MVGNEEEKEVADFKENAQDVDNEEAEEEAVAEG